ncbi:helix-turn-helix domain-containing protein [Faecalibacterium prausnitzii]|uniref:XRE family transcriptional regulator n=1 Tax=Faecalibacterium prausnitzii TaxID=853 RepID=A0A3E2TZA0_9FIRM|nr:helix-turn-helix transcriptional regulator [Faecalibacterium prausnitzii]RGB88091.1 XRE family transcriptional regulator [Faecalibacterium prausnitzii]
MKLSCAKIVAEMKRQRLTSSSLANKALCSVSTVQAVRNERNVSENSAKRIAQALGVTVDDLKED